MSVAMDKVKRLTRPLEQGARDSFQLAIHALGDARDAETEVQAMAHLDVALTLVYDVLNIQRVHIDDYPTLGNLHQLVKQ